MITFTWREEQIPADLPVRQVHGWLADAAGRFLIQDRPHEGKFLLPGGQISPEDRDWTATLQREGREESQVTIDPATVTYLGHQVVTGDPHASGPYAQVRLLVLITGFGPARPDPDSGQQYRRLMTSAARAAVLLNWGEPGHQQAGAAARTARLLGIPADAPAPDSYA